MTRRVLLFVVVFAGTVVAGAIQAENGESMVHLRIEGDEKTIFDGNVLTKVRKVNTESGGTHKCDGTNNRINSVPGATVTGALHTAANQEGFTWDG